jgi:hypothetical protein
VKRQNGNENQDPQKILVRQLELADGMRDLTTRQREAIRSEDWEGLKAILDDKDQRIHAFQETEKCLKREKAPGGMINRVPALKTVLSAIESRLVAAQSMEEECRRLLIDRKNQTAKTLQEIKRTHGSIKRFRSRRSAIPRFVDLRR